MHSYHVYFSTKEGCSEELLLSKVHEMMQLQIEAKEALGYRVLRMTEMVLFDEFPTFHLIVDYPTAEAREQGFAAMKPKYKEEPHLSVMQMADNFRAGFSEDDTSTPAANTYSCDI